MGNLIGVAISPHPPIILKEIGGGEERKAQKTIEGLNKIAEIVLENKPEVIICITPHGNVFSDGICILNDEYATGNLKSFGHPEISMEKAIDIDFNDYLIDALQEEEIPSVFLDENIAKEYNLKVELDHGVIVPLSFIDKKYNNYKILHITIGMLKHLELYRIGKLIGDTIMLSDKQAMVLVSGDLSHCLTKESPYSYNPEGRAFDNTIVSIMEDQRFEELLNINSESYTAAAECGLKPIIMGLGTLDGYSTTTEVFSYEGPFGVGYMNTFIKANKKDKVSILKKHTNEKRDIYDLKKRTENIYVALARASIEEWVKKGKCLDWEVYKEIILPTDALEELEKQRAGAFVSIHNNGNLRGCIGTFYPAQENLADEIINNAVDAASEDSRFYPIRRNELEDLEIKVDVLGELQPICDIEDLDVKKYGVVVVSKDKQGILLPDIEGVTTPQQQVNIAKEKAGILQNDEVKLYRFEVIRYQ
ncbi:AmmeMemoRadiSam system protein A [Alkaliphilus pronyensis]|uniref:AmmeMemoRadiSam system protein A n=1 Tax=Alkaliphilus pronyensis TaxID=1482732 RepID=A0A6I0F1F2_9FIRM|nr:AmmeMemoRadiSam system protein A [Alkaliphilus pronyensis]KAB3534792.1 AmmeMemoRadiSam system protein A [Alkaliphilus pronyensis]